MHGGGYYVFTMSHCPSVYPIILLQHRHFFHFAWILDARRWTCYILGKIVPGTKDQDTQKIRINVKLVLICGGITWPRTVFSFLVVCLCDLVCIVSCGKCQIGWLPPAGVWYLVGTVHRTSGAYLMRLISQADEKGLSLCSVICER